MLQILLKNKLISYLILIIILFTGFPDKLIGQSKTIISGGIGAPELFNAGVRYQINQTQIGLSLGTLPIFSFFTGSVTGHINYHFAGSSRFSEIRPWYGKFGLTFEKYEDLYKRDKFLYFNLNIGRDFNFSKKAGIELYAGLSFQLFHDRLTKIQHTTLFEYTEDYIPPSLGIGFFYKI